MSWSGISSNQCVSCENLQDAVTTGVFILKNTIPSSTPAKYKQITKAEAENYVYIQSITGKASNQLVVKSNLVAIATTSTTTTTITPITFFIVRDVYSSSTGQFQMVSGSADEGLVCYISSNYGSTFTPRIVSVSDISGGYSASNAGGTLFAVSTYSYVYTSLDGITWTQRIPSSYGSSNAGLVIASNTIFNSRFGNGYLSASSNSGDTWTELTAMGGRNWGPVMSLGNYLIAGLLDGTVTTKVYISHNSGASLTYTFGYSTTQSILAVGIAASGQYMYVIADGNSGRYYRSVNSGQTFSTVILNSSSQKFTAACNSKNAEYLLLFRAQLDTGKTIIMRSVDYGVSFSYIISSPFEDKVVIQASMSDDGTYVAVSVQVDGGIEPYEAWLSLDAGINWTQKF